MFSKVRKCLLVATRTRFPRDNNRSGGAPEQTDIQTYRQRFVSGRPGRRRLGSGRRGRPAEHLSPVGRQSWKKYPVQRAAVAPPFTPTDPSAWIVLPAACGLLVPGPLPKLVPIVFQPWAFTFRGHESPGSGPRPAHPRRFLCQPFWTIRCPIPARKMPRIGQLPGTRLKRHTVPAPGGLPRRPAAVCPLGRTPGLRSLPPLRRTRATSHRLGPELARQTD